VLFFFLEKKEPKIQEQTIAYAQSNTTSRLFNPYARFHKFIFAKTSGTNVHEKCEPQVSWRYGFGVAEKRNSFSKITPTRL